MQRRCARKLLTAGWVLSLISVPLGAQMDARSYAAGSSAVTMEVIEELLRQLDTTRQTLIEAPVAKDSMQDRLASTLLAIIELQDSARRIEPTRGRRIDSLWMEARTARARADSLTSRIAQAEVRWSRLHTARASIGDVLAQSSPVAVNLRESAAQYEERDVTVAAAARLTEVAELLELKAYPRFTSIPSSGGLIYHQTVRSRERNEGPSSLPETTNSGPQEIGVGCHYIWIRRGSVDTSDPNRHICISKDTRLITLVEEGTP